ncbi:hypothetical protein SVIOM342S_02479 [Streptomyces violaceorubidus]
MFTVDEERFPKLSVLAEELRREGVRVVSAVELAVPVAPGNAVYDGGTRARVRADVFVRDATGGGGAGSGRPGDVVFPDFTHAGAREWWGGLHEERWVRGFRRGVARPGRAHVLRLRGADVAACRHGEGRGGDRDREAHKRFSLALLGMAGPGTRAWGRRPAERAAAAPCSGWAGLQRYGGAWFADVATGWPGLRASLARVLGPLLLRDVAVGEQAGLVHVRVELGLHLLVVEVFGPPHEVVDGALGPVAVVHLEGVALAQQPGLGAVEGFGRRAGEDAQGLPVAVDGLADEVVRGDVAHLLDAVLWRRSCARRAVCRTTGGRRPDWHR